MVGQTKFIIKYGSCPYKYVKVTDKRIWSSKPYLLRHDLLSRNNVIDLDKMHQDDIARSNSLSNMNPDLVCMSRSQIKNVQQVQKIQIKWSDSRHGGKSDRDVQLLFVPCFHQHAFYNKEQNTVQDPNITFYVLHPFPLTIPELSHAGAATLEAIVPEIVKLSTTTSGVANCSVHPTE